MSTLLKFFQYSNGHIDYTVVAPDIDQAKDYLFLGGADVRPPVPGDDFEHYTWTELAPDLVRNFVCHTNDARDDYGAMQLSLTQCADGDWFCSEH